MAPNVRYIATCLSLYDVYAAVCGRCSLMFDDVDGKDRTEIKLIHLSDRSGGIPGDIGPRYM